VVPVLTQPDALPGAQIQFAVGDGDGQRGTQETCFHMGRLRTHHFVSHHYVRSLMSPTMSSGPSQEWRYGIP
jgi:hypothetical protein